MAVGAFVVGIADVVVAGAGMGMLVYCGEAAALVGVCPGDTPVAPGLCAYELYGDCGCEGGAGESLGRLFGGKANAAADGVGEGDCWEGCGGEKAGAAAGVGSDGGGCGWAMAAGCAGCLILPAEMIRTLVAARDCGNGTLTG